MTKKDFIIRTNGMTNPRIYEIQYPDWPLLSCVLMVGDENGRKVEIYCLRLSKKAYVFNSGDALQGTIDKFSHDALSAKRKYEKWLHDIFGNYCASELRI